MTWYYDVAAGQLLGQRNQQEDAFALSRSTAPGAESEFVSLLLSDGAGGEASGHIASGLAAAEAARVIYRERVVTDAPRTLRKAVKRANTSIANAVERGRGAAGMGCTLIAVAISDDRMHWASVGDSHLYLARDGKLSKLNEDHSYGGLLALMSARGQPLKRNPAWPLNALVSALNGGEISRIDCPSKGRTLRSGDRLVLASDGLDTLEFAEMSRLVCVARSSTECLNTLLQAVREADSQVQDNTTVLVATVDPREVGEPTEVEQVADSFESRILRDYAADVGSLVD